MEMVPFFLKPAVYALDPFAFVPAVLVGLFARGLRDLLIGGGIAWAIIIAIKLPTIQRVAEELDRPDPNLPFAAVTYIGSVLMVVGLVMLIRRIFKGRWWSSS